MRQTEPTRRRWRRDRTRDDDPELEFAFGTMLAFVISATLLAIILL